MIPHVISEREVTTERDEWRQYQSQKEIPVSESERLDHYWRDVMDCKKKMVRKSTHT